MSNDQPLEERALYCRRQLEEFCTQDTIKQIDRSAAMFTFILKDLEPGRSEQFYGASYDMRRYMLYLEALKVANRLTRQEDFFFGWDEAICEYIDTRPKEYKTNHWVAITPPTHDDMREYLIKRLKDRDDKRRKKDEL